MCTDNKAHPKAADHAAEATGAHFVHPPNDLNVMSGHTGVVQVKQEYGVALSLCLSEALVFSRVLP